MIQQVFRFLGTVISLYMMVILIRIIFTWFRGVHTGRAEQFLASITDPYLNWFRHHIPVRFGALDFSPVVGILVLGLFNTVANQIAFSGSITLGFVLAVIITALWSAFSFFLTLFLVVGIIRLVGMLANIDQGGRFWIVIEQIINPVLQATVRPFLRGRFTNYRDSLLIFIGVLVAVLILGRLGVGFLARVIGSMPI
ncbi:MAG: YggT family protein [Alkalispirochaeta sp.]|jgi:YggT family protein